MTRWLNLFAFCIAAFAACSPLSAAPSGTLVRDDRGAPVRLTGAVRRIVSIAPGATEMLFAAGAGDRVVGTAEFSDAPAAARRIPRIGDAHAVDLERVLALAPDVVVVWEDGNSSAQIATLERLQLPIYRVRVASLADLPASIERLGDLAGTAPAARAEAARLRAKLTDIAAIYRGRAPLRVFLEIWNEPLYTIGGAHPISDAVRYCGGLNIFGNLRGNGPTISIEAVIARDPQAIVAIAPVGAARVWLAAWRRFPSIDAVQRGALLPFEDQRLSRLGPGTIDATEVLCAQLATARAAHPGGPRIDQSRKFSN